MNIFIETMRLTEKYWDLVTVEYLDAVSIASSQGKKLKDPEKQDRLKELFKISNELDAVYIEAITAKDKEFVDLGREMVQTAIDMINDLVE